MPDYTRIWLDAFSDPKGGFYERLDHNHKPIDLPKRLLTQCRQIYVHALSGVDTQLQFDWMVKNYRDKNGGWKFSDTDNKYDLYAHAFVILACAATYNADIAKETLTFVKKNLWRIDEQNPLMHLLEACLAMACISRDPIYRDTADEILALFFDRFFNGKTLAEFFEADGTRKKNHIEAGHQAEWIWLLSECERVFKKDDQMITDAKTALFTWVKTHGIDTQYGGIFNAQTEDGTVIDNKKRIWPICEAIRAARVMGDTALADQLTACLKEKYITKDGFWIEMLGRDLTPAVNYLPGTTPYHIYGALKD